MRSLALLAVPFLLFACGDSAPSPDAAADASPPDAGALDAPGDTDAGADLGVDAGPPAPTACSICRRDGDCQPGATCLVLAAGERACGAPCATDDDCAAFGDYH